ncbi:MAG TPA: ribonuclease P protein component [Pseudomonadales bacterium]|nr:ribonuclease P protein component [Pseudomonadales bacterium]
MIKQQGFSRALRLLTPRDYKRVFDNTRFRASKPTLLVLAQPNDLPNGRLGLVIAKKHVKKAVQRNQVKRIIRESFRQHQAALEGLDFVVLARPGLAKVETLELRTMIDELWARVIKQRAKQTLAEPAGHDDKGVDPVH